MSINISRKDVMWSYLGIIMTLGTNLFLLPLILNCLTSDELGLWYTFQAVGNIAVLFDFGFKATMARNITYAWCGTKELKKVGIVSMEKAVQPNFILLNKVIKSSQKIYFLISLIAVFFLTSIGSIYIFFVSQNLFWEDIVFAWFIFIFGVFLNLYYGYLNSFLTGVGAIAESNVATVIARGIQLIVSIVMLIMGYGILSVSVAYTVYGIVFRQIARYLFNRYENIGQRMKKYNCKISNRQVSEVFHIVWHNAWRDGLVSFATFLSSQATTLLCSGFLSLKETASYGLSLQLVNAIASISTVYFSTYQPKMQETYVQKSNNKIKSILSMALTVYYVLFIGCSLLLCTFGIPIVEVIKSNTKLDVSILIVLCVYMLLYKNHILFVSYIAGTNRIPYVKAFLFSSVSMVIVAVVLLNYTELGVWALVLSPMLVELCYDNWYWPKFVLKELNMKFYEIFILGFYEIKKCIFM